MHKNPWAHMGMGFCRANLTEGSDLSPYLQLENIDPKWLEAVGYRTDSGGMKRQRDA